MITLEAAIRQSHYNTTMRVREREKEEKKRKRRISLTFVLARPLQRGIKKTVRRTDRQTNAAYLETPLSALVVCVSVVCVCILHCGADYYATLDNSIIIAAASTIVENHATDDDDDVANSSSETRTL